MVGCKEAVVLGTRIHMLHAEKLISVIVEAGRQNKGFVVDYANAHTLNLAYENPWLRGFLNRADIVFCDGFGALLGAKLLRNAVKVEHRITAPDHLDRLAVELERAGLSLYLLGSEPGVTDKAINRLKSVASALRVRGRHGYFEKSGSESDAVIRDINSFKPDVLYVGFGMPLQEQWIESNINAIDARVFLALGACLDFYAGTSYRGPKWVTQNGGEWMTRLISEPRRLWRRYLVGNPLFLIRVVRERMRGTTVMPD